MESTRFNPIVNVTFDTDLDTLNNLTIIAEAHGLESLTEALEFVAAYTVVNTVEIGNGEVEPA